MNLVRTLSLSIGLALLLSPAVHGSQELLARSIKDARAEAIRTSEQLKSTLSALNALTTQASGDLRPAFNAFCGEIMKTEAAAVATRDRRNLMSTEGRQHFQGWQKNIEGIANQSLRKKAQKRFDSARASYDKVESSFDVASEKFKPFLADLRDVKKALEVDLTAGGVKAIRSTVKTANWDHQFVDRAINAALKEMDKMAKSLASEAK